MESQPESGDRRAWVVLAVLGVAALVGLALLLDLGPFADEELSEAELIAQGDEICAEARAGFEDVQRDEPVTANEARQITEELLDIARAEQESLEELNAPEELDPSLGRYLAARDEGIAQLRDGLDAIDDGDAFAYERAQAEVAAKQLDRLELAKRVGFSQCSRVLFGRDRLEADAEPPVPTDPSAPPTVANPPTGTP